MFAKMTVLASVSTSALALSATAFATPLVTCVGEEESFSISIESEGRVNVNGESAGLVSVEPLAATGPYASTFTLITSKGNEIRLTLGTGVSPVESYWDRGVRGAECGAGSTLDSSALASLVARSKALKKEQWLLADCETTRRAADHFKVTYYRGFAPGTLVLQSTGDGRNGEEVRYVVDSFAQEGAAGTSYTTLTGEGVYMYSAAGRHSRDLSNFVIAHSNIRGTDRIEVGNPLVDDHIRQCKITNLWHVEKLLSK